MIVGRLWPIAAFTRKSRYLGNYLAEEVAMLVLFLLFMAVVMVAAAIFDRTRAGKRLRAQGGFTLHPSRRSGQGSTEYPPPTDVSGMNGL
jgi:ribose/xylose/arabinose/galactoside ABC-type transport system permease subunit